MNIKKMIACSISSLFFVTQAQATPDIPAFMQAYQNLLGVMLNSYKETVSSPLDSRIFDISKPLFYNFLRGGNRAEYQKPFLAMRFYNDFKVNDKATNFCFILFDGNKVNELNTYLYTVFPTADDTVEYLVAHEFGHCLAAHQRVLGNIPVEPDPTKEEQIADMFAMGFFMSRGQNDLAKIIIRQMADIPKTDIHHNPEVLRKFYYLFDRDKPSINNIETLFKTSYKYFQEINSNPDKWNDEIKNMK